MLVRVWRDWNPSLCTAVGNVKGTTGVENSRESSKKSNIELPCNPAVPLLDIYPKEVKAGLEQIFIHPCS